MGRATMIVGIGVLVIGVILQLIVVIRHATQRRQ
jgi:hypothetical protein